MRDQRSMYALLGLLCIEPMSGYQLRALIERSIGNFWTESYGQIYPVLNALAEQGLVTRTSAMQGKRQRHIYTITASGRDAVRDWLIQPVEATPSRNELLLKLFLGNNTDTATLTRHVQAFQALHQAAIVQFNRLIAELSANPKPDTQFWLITLRYGLHHSNAMLMWCAETLTTLEEQTP